MIYLTIQFIKLMYNITIFMFKCIFCLVMLPVWFIIGYFKGNK
nr:MAG TPA: hypothetical protein [Bacteriophage sp.]